MSSDAPSDIADRLGALRLEYARRLPQRAAELDDRFGALAAHWTVPEALELRRLAHNLTGSGASYGWPGISTAARRVEQALDATLAGAGPPAPAELAAVGAALQALIAAAAAVPLD